VFKARDVGATGFLCAFLCDRGEESGSWTPRQMCKTIKTSSVSVIQLVRKYLAFERYIWGVLEIGGRLQVCPCVHIAHIWIDWAYCQTMPVIRIRNCNCNCMAQQAVDTKGAGHGRKSSTFDVCQSPKVTMTWVKRSIRYVRALSLDADT
jgi:hypothetical protein